MTRSKTNGLIAAPFTPMRAGGALNLELIGPYARWLHASGLAGAFICGTTGESMSLTVEERKQLTESWVAVAPPDLRVIVHVGHNSLSDAENLAKHAAATGAYSIACMAPFFFKSNGVAGLVDWCAKVASAAPELPFYFYHIPSMTGVSLPMLDFLTAAAGRIPSLAGIKYTHEDMDDYGRCLQFAGGRYDMLFGRDEMLLSALELGARGAVGSTYNFAAPLYQRLIEAFDRGDKDAAGTLQARAVEMIDACLTCGANPNSALKWVMRRIGLDCGPPRLPLAEVTAAQATLLDERLDQLNFNWISRHAEATPAAS